MQFIVRGDKVELTDSMKDYLKTKSERLEKYFENSEKVEVKVLCRVKGRDHKVEITIPYKNFIIRSEASHSDMYASIDLVMDKLERQFRKYKTKLLSKTRIKEIANDIEDFFEETDGIVKRKEIFLKPIDEEEAIVQMELSGHDFYIFKNFSDNNSISVIYKREDGNYGIIKTN